MANDAELETFRQNVNCAALLEQFGNGWRLDQQESTRTALKYRSGPGQIIIVNHSGRGWWDVTSSAKGDVFTLVQHLQPGMNFGEVRKVLRQFVGMTPTFPPSVRESRSAGVGASPAERWNKRPLLRKGDRTWRYLREERRLPAFILERAVTQDAIRHGAFDSAWFAHTQNGLVTHVEVRGPTYKGSLRGGSKSLFRFGANLTGYGRLAVLEAPIDALSLSALEGERGDTLYVATGGGMGPGTLAALREAIENLATRDGMLTVGTDANSAGDRYAIQLTQLATEGTLRCERLRPADGEDWNDVLKQQGRGSQ